MLSLAAQAHVVRRDHHPAVVHHLVERRGRPGLEGVVQHRGGTAPRDARGPVRPGHDREGVRRPLLGRDHQRARRHLVAGVARRRVEDPPGLRTLGQRPGEGLGPEQLTGLRRELVGRGVEVVGARSVALQRHAHREQREGDDQSAAAPGVSNNHASVGVRRSRPAHHGVIAAGRGSRSAPGSGRRAPSGCRRPPPPRRR